MLQKSRMLAQRLGLHRTSAWVSGPDELRVLGPDWPCAPLERGKVPAPPIGAGGPVGASWIAPQIVRASRCSTDWNRLLEESLRSRACSLQGRAHTIPAGVAAQRCHRARDWARFAASGVAVGVQRSALVVAAGRGQQPISGVLEADRSSSASGAANAPMHNKRRDATWASARQFRV